VLARQKGAKENRHRPGKVAKGTLEFQNKGAMGAENPGTGGGLGKSGKKGGKTRE